MKRIKFYFDPICPWTWVASRWVVDLVEQGLVEVQWLPMSLGILNEGSEISKSFQAPMMASKRALRLIAYLARESRNEEVARFYTALGEGFFLNSEVTHIKAIDDAIESANLSELAEYLDDSSLDVQVRQFHDVAFAAAGPDVGSPILQIADSGAAIYGPIIGYSPKGVDARRLYEHLLGIMELGVVYEIKRGRNGLPSFD